jgi:hypothetical protein
MIYRYELPLSEDPEKSFVSLEGITIRFRTEGKASPRLAAAPGNPPGFCVPYLLSLHRQVIRGDVANLKSNQNCD